MNLYTSLEQTAITKIDIMWICLNTNK